jgi:hypothetical protein
MTTPLEIAQAVKLAGGRLEQAGDKIRVLLPADCSPTLTEQIRQHKQEILTWLEARNSNLAPDCLPWIGVARQILDGEFDGCNKSTCESLIIGLQHVEHPTCKRALNKCQRWLKTLKSRKAKP